MLVPLHLLESFCQFLESDLGADVRKRKPDPNSVELGRAMVGETFIQLRAVHKPADPDQQQFEVICGNPEIKKEIMDNWFLTLAVAQEQESNDVDASDNE